MKFVKSLTEEEQRTLLDASRYAPWTRFRQRTHAVYLSGKRYRINELADIFEVDRDTVSIWLNAWEEHGLLGLRDHDHPGRPSKCSVEDREWLNKVIDETPHQSRAIHAKFQERTGMAIAAGTLKRWLTRDKWVWKRCRRSLKMYRDAKSFDEGRRVLDEFHKRESLGELDVFYMDESGLSSRSCVPYAWQQQGKTRELPANVLGRLNVIGLINRDHQSFFRLEEESVTHKTVIDTVNGFIDKRKPEKLTIVVMDNAPIHKKAVKLAQWDWLAHKIWVWFLPTYSPELNPIEILWKEIKYHWLAWDAFSNFSTMRVELQNIFSGFGQKYRINFA